MNTTRVLFHIQFLIEKRTEYVDLISELRIRISQGIYTKPKKEVNGIQLNG
jgi:hypothetical protein